MVENPYLPKANDKLVILSGKNKKIEHDVSKVTFKPGDESEAKYLSRASGKLVRSKRVFKKGDEPVIYKFDVAGAVGAGIDMDMYGDSYTVEVFKWFPFSVGEIGLMACVLYHAYTGIRITLLDFKPEWWQYQRQSTIAVWVLFAVTFAPIAFFMFSQTLNHCSELSAIGQSCFTFPTP